MHNRILTTGLALVSLGAAVLMLSWPNPHLSASDQPSNQQATQAPPGKAATGAYSRAKRRCLTQCDSDNGLCNSEVRRSRQECSKQALNGGNDPFSIRPNAYDYYCGYFELAQCATRGCV